MKYFFAGCCLVAVTLLSFSAHPIYLSTTEIDYNKKAKTLEIAIKVFSDDLQEALTKEAGEPVEIATDREHKDATALIIDYLTDHFIVEINGKQKPFRYLTRRVVQDDFYATWILLEVPKVGNIKSFRLKNDILIEEKDGQQNHVKFRESKDLSYARSVAVEGKETLQLK
jgi:hypothetical protein